MKNKTIYHIHHKIPKHMGGSDDPDNLVQLTVEEHAEAHRLLFEQYRNKFDYIAYMVLSKQLGYEEANYMKLLGPKKWTVEGLQKLKESGRKRTGAKNGFYGKHHTTKSKKKMSEANSGDNNWIKGINPSLLPYTKQYQITYTSGEVKIVAGLKAISTEFNVSIENVYATIKRIQKGNIPKRGVFSGILIRELT